MENKIPKDTYLPLYILIFIVIILWLGSFFAINESIEKRSFQDVFNAINTLFSGLAMAGIIFTIYLQKKELGLQRKELRDTRHEFEIQNETLKKQRFENTYFQLLDLHHEIVDKLTHTSLTDRHYEKRDVFARALKDFEQELDNAINLQIRMEDEATAFGRPFQHQEDFFITTGYGNFFKEYQNSLSHYFRNIYHAFKFVYLSKIITDDEKLFYSAIIRAQLSSEELTLSQIFMSIIDRISLLWFFQTLHVMH